MKTILVPVEQHEAAEFAVRLAILTATKFECSIEGFALRMPPLAGIGWDPASVAMINSADWDEGRTAAEAKTLFETLVDERGIAEARTAGGHGSADWRWNAEPVAGDEFLGSYGRAFDLTVVGQPRSKVRWSSITTLEAALFDSGGPVLIAPPRLVTAFGETVVVAWNGSSETARTIAFAMPLLRQARRVIVLADDGSIGHRPSGELVQRRLERNGVAAELKLLPGGRIRSGEAILEAAAGLGCDLLIKGAYTQSRLRQMIFGGATNHVLAEADVPVFMAH